MEYIGYFASILIGVALGLIGGGGSILTVPVLVYLFAIEPVVATSYSLFIVGLTSGIGSVGYFKKGLVNIKTAIAFGIPSIIAVFTTRALIVPAIPKEVFTIGEFIVTKSILMMLLFAVLMIAASYSMIKKDKKTASDENSEQKFNYPLILIEGTVVGILTGLVGAGGGFLITISAFAIIGIFIGTALSKKIDGAKLKPAFGWFVLAMGIYIITKELFFS